MGRRRRSYAPDTIFHLVSRLHRREHWLTPPVRSQVVGLIQRYVARTDAQLIAYVVMPNHLHLLVRQGQAELAAVMQPLLRSVAHRVQRHHGIEGTVVERRYRDRACITASHVREAVVYIHLNAWRAGLCRDDLAYPWSSHPAYLADAQPADFGIDLLLQRRVMELFAQKDHVSRSDRCRDYLSWVEWRMQRDGECDSSGTLSVDPLLHRPGTQTGDAAWVKNFVQQVPIEVQDERALPDLRDYLLGQLAGRAPDVPLDRLRGSWLSRPLGRLRAQLIRYAADRGYGTVALADFFDVSPAAVSRIRHAPGGEH